MEQTVEDFFLLVLDVEAFEECELFGRDVFVLSVDDALQLAELAHQDELFCPGPPQHPLQKDSRLVDQHVHSFELVAVVICEHLLEAVLQRGEVW